MSNRIYDVRRLRAWHARIAELDDDAAPRACVIVPPAGSSRDTAASSRAAGTSAQAAGTSSGMRPGGGVAVVAGSFNPPTTAHLNLCDGALSQPDIGAVWLSLAVHTVDKEQVSGAALEDRLCMLEMLVESRPGVGVVLCNRGLYVEQAAALRRALVRSGQELVFVVGFDKILQILDARYYADRAASLGELFGLARFLVAKRGGYGREALDELLDQTANRPYRGRIAPLTTLPASHDPSLSSTSVRAAHAEDTRRLAGGDEVPAAVWAFMAATGVYESPVTLDSGETLDRYALRSRLREALVAEAGGDFSAAAFEAAVALATADSDSGRELRRLLAQDAVSWQVIFRHISA